MRVARAVRGIAAALAVVAALLHAPSASASCTMGPPNPTRAENCSTDPSTWSTGWQADRSSFVYDTRVLGGYASRTSVNRGEQLHLYIQSPQKPSGYSIAFYRLGWYGGAGGRIMAQAQGLASPSQPPCRWENGGTANAYFTCNNWLVSYTLTIPDDWTSGVYLAAITSEATAPSPEPAGLHYRHDVIFVVRDDTRRSSFIYQQPVLTEQAYNSYYYGPSLYNTQVVQGHVVPLAKASFERPFDALDNLQFYRYELPFIRFVESEGYDVVYSTDIDNHERTAPIAQAQAAFIVSGHPEYWTKPMYDHVQAARDAGVHLGFFSGNTLYWQARLERETATAGDDSHETADRVVVVFRHPYPPNAAGLGDPNPDPSLQTIYWRDAPLFRDEEALVGVHFTHPENCPEHIIGWASGGTPPRGSLEQQAPELLADPQPLIATNTSNWVYQGTGLGDGAAVPYVYGQESDAYEVGFGDPSCGHSAADPPARVPIHLAGTFALLSVSPFSARPTAKSPLVPTRQPVNSVVYQACSGAWVFAAGSIMWSNALGPSMILGKDYTSAAIRQMTRNVLDVYSGEASAASSAGACTGSLPLALTGIFDVLF